MRELLDFIKKNAVSEPVPVQFPFRLKNGVCLPRKRGRPDYAVLDIAAADIAAIDDLGVAEASDVVWYVSVSSEPLGTAVPTEDGLVVTLPPGHFLGSDDTATAFCVKDIVVNAEDGTAFLVDVSVFRGKITVFVVSVITAAGLPETLSQLVLRIAETGVSDAKYSPVFFRAHALWGLAALDRMASDAVIGRILRFDGRDGTMTVV